MTKFASTGTVCQRVIDRHQLIANKARFRILCLLRDGWYSVNDIVEVIDAGQLSNISQQLKMLTLAGLVEKRRESRRVFYTLKDEKTRALIDFLEAQFMEVSQ